MLTDASIVLYFMHSTQKWLFPILKRLFTYLSFVNFLSGSPQEFANHFTQHSTQHVDKTAETDSTRPQTVSDMSSDLDDIDPYTEFAF